MGDAPMRIHERLANLRKMHGYTQQRVAEALGISRGAYANYEIGTREPDAKTLSALAELYGVSVDYLVGRTDNPALPSETVTAEKGDVLRIPIVGKTHCGEPIWANEHIEGWIELPPNSLAKGNYFALYVEGDSMSPMIPDGSLIIVRQQPSVENGQIAVVLWDDENEAHVRRVYVDEKQKLVTLQAVNPAYPPITVKPNKVRILGLVKKYFADVQAATIDTSTQMA